MRLTILCEKRGKGRDYEQERLRVSTEEEATAIVIQKKANAEVIYTPLPVYMGPLRIVLSVRTSGHL